MVACAASSGASSNTISECFSENNERRIAGCSELIDNPNLDTGTKSLAYAMRALALSLKGELAQALPWIGVARIGGMGGGRRRLGHGVS